MNFYDVIEKRTSIRKFKNTEINYEKLSRMINAAMRSPSWKNKTSYKIMIVQDHNKRQKLANTIMNDTNEAAEAVMQAPITVVIVADPSDSGNIAHREYYMVDSAVALEHLILAATEEGYGTCWIGAFDEDRVRNILGIPQDFRVVAMTPVGEIAEYKDHNPPKNINDYVYLDNWKEPYTEKQPVLSR